MNCLGLGMSITKQDATAGNGGGNPPEPPPEIPEAAFVVTQSVIQPNTLAGEFKIVLTFARDVDTVFNVEVNPSSAIEFELGSATMTVAAGQTESSVNSINTISTELTNIAVTGVDEDEEVVVTNEAEFTIEPAP